MIDMAKIRGDANHFPLFIFNDVVAFRFDRADTFRYVNNFPMIVFMRFNRKGFKMLFNVVGDNCKYQLIFQKSK